ncbi:3-hydroxybutyryl-CoA dehydratase [Reyranella soli]|uniref:3-hydroxybutyryl-CoA dehydratase n=1 Tax=Reyranella soli TaxID=1230389 RepID=A0A512N634_9HYPH|nr:3-hydroxybutyryl-CoA dehydratase [Reyranella soli]
MGNFLSSPAEEIVVTVADGIVTVTLNRPAKRNAVSLAMWRRLAEIFAGVGQQDGVRAVVLTGAGGNFCAGADISEFATVRADSKMGEAYEAVADRATRAVRDCELPTIAAVSGYAMGGGCGLALACDFRIGDASTRMGIPAARLGIVYGPLDCSLLLRQVGLANAKRVLYSGRAFDLADCRRMGLADMAAEQGSALEAAHAFAADLSKNAPLSIRGAKLVLDALATGTADARAGEIDVFIGRAMDSADYKEGAAAFAAKRPPRFVGR